MYRTTAYVVAALALIALGIGMKQRWFGSTEPTPLALEEVDKYGAVATSTISHTKPGALTSNLPPTQLPNIARSDQSPLSSVILSPARKSTDPPATSKVASSIDTEAAESAAAIGRPFPVSASVEAGCRRRSTKDQEDCKEIHQLLSKMAQEQRDPAWSKNTEAKLRNLVMTAESNKYSLRAIECRQSLCAVEVASLYGLYSGDIDVNDPLSTNLSNWTSTQGYATWLGMWGYETDPSGNKITVAVITYKRR